MSNPAGNPAGHPAADDPTNIGGYVSAVVHGLESRGVDVGEALAAAGLQGLPANDPMVRVPVASVHKLFEIAVAETGDPLFGLHTAQFLHAGHLHAFGYGLLASSSLADFLDKFVCYYRFICGLAVATRVDAPRCTGLEFDGAPDGSVQCQDMFILFLVRLLRELSDGRATPESIELHRETPPDAGLRHRRAFGCPVQFETRTTRILFDPTLLDLHFSGANEEIAAHCERIMLGYLAKIDRSDVTSRVRALLIQDMPSGLISKERIAAKLFMSPRTLQIKLARRGTTFHDIVSRTRQTLACSYMSNSALSVTEVAYMVGYSDTSNFSRAFRRWTGLSPRDYRARLTGSVPVVESVDVSAMRVPPLLRVAGDAAR